MKVNKPQSPLSVPDDLVIKRNQDELEFILPFVPGSKVMLWIFTIGWNTIVIGAYFGAFFADFEGLIIFGLLHLLLGIYLAFYALSATFNTVHLKVSREKIEKHEGPYYVPFHMRHYEKNWSEIKKIFVDQVTHRHTTYDRLKVKSYYETDRLLMQSSVYPHLRVIMSEIKSFLSETE